MQDCNVSLTIYLELQGVFTDSVITYFVSS